MIKDIIAREILDSRGNPTIEVKMELDNGVVVKSSVPSGASTGEKEALELRDNDSNRYNGKGVLTAVNNVNKIIKPALLGEKLNQRKIDNMLIELDGTPNKSKLGANAILAVSLCALKAAAARDNKELYRYVSNGKVTLPLLLVNVINGGMHAANNLDVQEFMIIPIVKTVHERIRVASEVFQSLKKILKAKGLTTSVGDEGGFAPVLQNNKEALDLIVLAIEKAGYKAGKDVYIGLDVAASSFYNKRDKIYEFESKKITGDGLIEYYQDIIKNYPIISIEDAFDENDIDSMKELTRIMGQRIMLVGDDYFVTNTKMLEKGIIKGYCNAILLKANQIGTISEMCDTIKMASDNKYKMIMSHRSGETEDTFIADLSCGLNIPFIKTGSMSRGERIAKYNRLMAIEDELLKK